jgi:hypothetical protein
VNVLPLSTETVDILRSFFGHAQKWLNMTFKYIYVMGKQRISGFDRLYDLCHVPLDNILIDALQEKGFEPLPCPWSRLTDYDTYLERQRWMPNQFKPMAPLDVEFRSVMDGPRAPALSATS